MSTSPKPTSQTRTPRARTSRTRTLSRYAVQATDLRKTYPAGRGKPPTQALDGLTFAVEPGTVYGLLGPNGAGKSTTVRILCTLSRPDSGEASVAGVDVARHPDAVRHRIGLVGQKPSSDPMATGRENLLLAARIQGLNRSAAAQRATWLLDRFGIAAAADRLVKTWSGGMARKLDVAIGLVHRPEVLFLDEPTTGLDPEARAELWAEIGRMAGDDGMTVLLTTHYLDEADRLAHRLAIIEHGVVAVEGTPEQLKTELRGDVLQVELEDEDGALRATAVVTALAGLDAVVRDGRILRARTDAGARVVPVVFAALAEARIPVVSATVARPSLDDVYLRYAGRSFEAVA
jgi:ABC-2 type transport system ATP-binding protein